MPSAKVLGSGQRFSAISHQYQVRPNLNNKDILIEEIDKIRDIGSNNNYKGSIVDEIVKKKRNKKKENLDKSKERRKGRGMFWSNDICR